MFFIGWGGTIRAFDIKSENWDKLHENVKAVEVGYRAYMGEGPYEG